MQEGDQGLGAARSSSFWDPTLPEPTLHNWILYFIEKTSPKLVPVATYGYVLNFPSKKNKQKVDNVQTQKCQKQTKCQEEGQAAQARLAKVRVASPSTAGRLSSDFFRISLEYQIFRHRLVAGFKPFETVCQFQNHPEKKKKSMGNKEK